MKLTVPAVFILLLAACGGTDGDQGCTADSAVATTSVHLVTNAFSPSCFKVPLAAQVTFSNDDVTAHTVTTDAGEAETFDSGHVLPGDVFTHAFGSVGTTRLHCTLHAGMMATAIIQ